MQGGSATETAASQRRHKIFETGNTTAPAAVCAVGSHSDDIDCLPSGTGVLGELVWDVPALEAAGFAFCRVSSFRLRKHLTRRKPT